MKPQEGMPRRAITLVHFLCIPPFLLRAALGSLFLAAAWGKWHFSGGQSDLYGQLARASPIADWLIIAVEIVLGLWLLSGYKRGAAAGTGIFLLAIFTGAIVADMLSAHPLPCGCFGAAWKHAHEPAVIEHGLLLGLLRNAGLMVIAAVLFFMPRKTTTRQ